MMIKKTEIHVIEQPLQEGEKREKKWYGTAEFVPSNA